MSDDTTDRQSARGTARQSDSDRQMRQMIADPEAYFTRARQEARREAHHYVNKRLNRLKTA